jgi:hypothetical protein
MTFAAPRARRKWVEYGITAHELKTWPEFFNAVWSGDKKFELRADDKSPSYTVGQYLALDEFDPATQQYTGRWFVVRVTYLLRGPSQFGLPAGVVVMAIEVVSELYA